MLVEKQRGALRLAAVSRGAARIGLCPGLPLADARARVPSLAVLAHDPAADATLLESLVRLARDYTPTVAADPPQGLILDIAGCVHLFGGEAGLSDAVTAKLAAQGLTARAGLADTPDAARALARQGVGQIEQLPVAALELEEDAAGALRRAGLRRIGELAALPRAVLAARFGPALTVALARLLGEEEQPFMPAPLVEPVTATLRFAEPIGRTEHVLDAMEALIVEAAAALARRGEGGRVFVLSLHRSDGHVARLVVETGAPTRDAALVLRLLVERIEGLADPLDPGFGYDAIDMDVPVSEALGERQASLAVALDSDDAIRVGEAIAPLLDRMAVRHGPEAVRRCRAGNSHVPERAGWFGGDGAGKGGSWPEPSPRDPPRRPLALLDPPQPVEVIAAVPDGPPRRFRWKGATYRIVRQEGPERIAPEWWRRPEGHGANPGRTRDYFRVEDALGHRFWLFRHGLYGAAATAPRWYVHGFFA